VKPDTLSSLEDEDVVWNPPDDEITDHELYTM
jgi:hypothetical protein